MPCASTSSYVIYGRTSDSAAVPNFLPGFEFTPRRIQDPILGIYNAAGEGQKTLAESDRSALGDLFSAVRVGDGSPPKCDVLLVYDRIDVSGRLSGAGQALADVARDSGASIVILATEHSSDLVGAAAKVKSLGSANVVLTIERKGPKFGAFFRALLDSMMSGKSMPMAWVALAPQHPGADHDGIPSTLYLSGAAVSLRRPTARNK